MDDLFWTTLKLTITHINTQLNMKTHQWLECAYTNHGIWEDDNVKHRLKNDTCHARFHLLVWPDAVDAVAALPGFKAFEGHYWGVYRRYEEDLTELNESLRNCEVVVLQVWCFLRGVVVGDGLERGFYNKLLLLILEN